MSETEKKYKKTSFATMCVVCGGAAILLLFPTYFACVLATLLNQKFTKLIPVLSVLIVVLLGFAVYRNQNGKMNRIGFFSTLGALIVVEGICGGIFHYTNIYIPSITMENTLDINDYLPFNGSEKLAHLDHDATLKFKEDDDLPRLDGATALVPLYASFVEAVYPEGISLWAKKREDGMIINNWDDDVIVKKSTTSRAYENLIEGTTDIIFVAQPSKEQIENAKEKGIEFNFTPLGYEAFVFIVNSENPLNDISFDQIKDIYSGRVANWKELGGADKEITAFQRESGSGSQTIFLHIMQGEEIIAPITHEVTGMEGLITRVSDYQNHKNAIGYSFRYYVEKMAATPNVKMLSLNGVEPTVENIKNGTYPIYDNFYAVTVKGKETENTLRFIQWILSDEGQELIEKTGYVGLKK